MNLEKELAEKTKNVTISETRALRDLMLLFDEGEVESDALNGSPDSIPSNESDIATSSRYLNSKSSLKAKSKAFPDLMTCPSVWAFLHECILSLKKEQWLTLPSNLTQQQSRAISKLQKNTDLFIKQSDKGGNLVLMTHHQYQTMCLKILSNSNWYSPIDNTFIQKTIDEFRALIGGGLPRGPHR